MVDPHNNDRDVHGHSTIKDVPDRDRGGMGWLPWVLGALLLLGLLWLLTRDNDEDRVVEPVAEETLAPTATETTPAAAMTNGTAAGTVATTAAYSGAELDRYLASQDPIGRTYTFDKVTFASGSSALSADSNSEIADVAAVLKRYPNARVALTGTADPSGDAAANQKLSADRANAVRDAIVKAGAAANQITTAAVGETGATATAGNRKVEMRVTAR